MLDAWVSESNHTSGGRPISFMPFDKLRTNGGWGLLIANQVPLPVQGEWVESYERASSHAPQRWIPAFAGMAVARGGSQPLRPSDGFLLLQEWLRSEVARSPCAPEMDSCFRRNGCGQRQFASPRPLTIPATL